MNFSNIVQLIQERDYQDLIAIRESDHRISYTMLFEAVDEITAQLKNSDGLKGDSNIRIGVRMPNGLGYILVALSVLKSKACFVPIPEELTPFEQAQLAEMTGLHAIISLKEGDTSIPIILPFDQGIAQLEIRPQTLVQFDTEAMAELNPAFIRFSSGTSAQRKGVVISHETLLKRIKAANELLKIGPHTRVLWTLPMAHHFAVSIILYLYFGATTVIETDPHPEAIFDTAYQSEITFLYGSPFHFSQLAACSPGRSLQHLSMAVATAFAVSESMAANFFDRFGIPVTQALGVIEVGLPVINHRDSLTDPTALGQVIPSFQWKLMSESNTETTSGELWLRGPGIFDAYINPWLPAEEALEQGGWFATGDIVEDKNQTGTLHLLGRCKSVINVGGMKVFPEEVEAILNSHPSVKLSRVFAMSHPALGSYPSAEIVPSEEQIDTRTLRTFCLARLANYKVPMDFHCTKKIELTASGKVKRCRMSPERNSG